MDELKIYFREDSELTEHEAIYKGYRNDVFVSISNQLFNVNVYDAVRLQQDFETELEEYGYFSIEPNLVLVKEVSKEQISVTIHKLFEQGFFNSLKPIDKDEYNNLFQDLNLLI